MRQAVMSSPGCIEFVDIPEPEPRQGEVKVRIHRIGICGSDIHVNKGLHPFTSYPVVQGHEWAGEIVSVGEGVSDLKPGQRVTATPQLVCGECPPCQRGDYNICDQLKVKGFQAPGCAQDYWITEADKVVPLPDDFSWEQGAFIEPVAVGCHSTRRAGALRQRNVVVIGAGPIGNLVAQMARVRGAEVLIRDVSDYRLDIARQCGIPFTSNVRQESLKEGALRCFGETGFGVAFECAGVESALTEVVDAVAKGGAVVAVAVYEEAPRVDMSVVGDRELSIIGTLMYRKEDFVEAVERVSRGEVVIEPMCSRQFPFKQYADAYDFIEEQGERSMKVFVALTQDTELLEGVST